MLILTRKQDETIVIDGRITVKIIRVKGKAIRLGIEAPPEVPIRRAELDVVSLGNGASKTCQA